MATWLRVDDPATGQVACEVRLLEPHEVDGAVRAAQASQSVWRDVPLDERIVLVERAIAHIVAHRERIARDITRQMGKPIAQALAEVDTMAHRATVLCQIAPEALRTEILPAPGGTIRRVVHEPVGVVVDIAPWNYPLLVVVNVVVPAVLAGNAVLVKHSPRTPRCGEHFAEAFAAAGAPEGLVQAVHLDHGTAVGLLQSPGIDAVFFTGSVRGGRQVYATVASARLVDVGLELGGKDAAYVRPDVDVAWAAAQIAEGALYNAGQSCCAIERVYVHRAVAGPFVDALVEAVRAWRPGDPTDPATRLGPMALPTAPAALQAQVEQAVAQGARVLTGGGPTQVGGQGRYFEPTVLVDVDDAMDVMQHESFGPLVPVAVVDDDDEALARIDDSAYGLTASIWTADLERAAELATRIDTGTVYANRCDYLDPELPWSGRRLSGKGVTLGHHGFAPMTRLKALLLQPPPG